MTPLGAVIRDRARSGPTSPPTFLGSATAPDGDRVRQLLEEVRQASRKRKDRTWRAAVAIAMVSIVAVSTR